MSNEERITLKLFPMVMAGYLSQTRITFVEAVNGSQFEWVMTYKVGDADITEHWTMLGEDKFRLEIGEYPDVYGLAHGGRIESPTYTVECTQSGISDLLRERHKFHIGRLMDSMDFEEKAQFLLDRLKEMSEGQRRG